MNYFEYYIPGWLKIPEFMLGFIIMVLTRAGNDGDYFYWSKSKDIDHLVLGDLVAFGFFVLILVQLIGFIGGEKAPLQSGVGALVMGVCYLTVGAGQLDLAKGLPQGHIRTTGLAMSHLALIQGLIVLADAAVSFIYFLKSKRR